MDEQVPSEVRLTHRMRSVISLMPGYQSDPHTRLTHGRVLPVDEDEVISKTGEESGTSVTPECSNPPRNLWTVQPHPEPHHWLLVLKPLPHAKWLKKSVATVVAHGNQLRCRRGDPNHGADLGIAHGRGVTE